MKPIGLLLTLVFVVLKLEQVTAIADWNWFWVLFPFLLGSVLTYWADTPKRMAKKREQERQAKWVEKEVTKRKNR